MSFQGVTKITNTCSQYNKLDKNFKQECKGKNLNAMHTCGLEKKHQAAFPDKIN